MYIAYTTHEQNSWERYRRRAQNPFRRKGGGDGGRGGWHILAALVLPDPLPGGHVKGAG